MVPITVAATVATAPMIRLFVNASHTAPFCTSQTLSHLSKVNPRQVMFDLRLSLNENTKVYTIGTIRNTRASAE